MPNVSGIYIYPIKSCGGISLSTCQVTRRGLADDRRWMLVDPRGEFLTQRTLPRMSLIRTEIYQGNFQVTAPGLAAFSLPNKPKGKTIHVNVWGDVGHAVDSGDETAKWFTRFLETPCRLVYQPQNEIREIHEGIEPERNTVSYADRYPLLVLSEASLSDLNSRLKNKIGMERFRPNIVVSGTRPFDEDDWHVITINDVKLEIHKSCIRCTIPTVNPQTGVMGKEPLTTLATYRKNNGSIHFGQNAIPYSLGILHVGNEITINS